MGEGGRLSVSVQSTSPTLTADPRALAVAAMNNCFRGQSREIMPGSVQGQLETGAFHYWGCQCQCLDGTSQSSFVGLL